MKKSLPSDHVSLETRKKEWAQASANLFSHPKLSPFIQGWLRKLCDLLSDVVEYDQHKKKS
jgi:hypothetical protein